MVRILSVSYNEALLHTRRLLLESRGYSVTSALGFKEALHYCQQGGFDLFIVGHSIPQSDKQALIHKFRESCPGPIVSLRKTNEADVSGADHYIDPDPKSVLSLVAKVFANECGE